MVDFGRGLESLIPKKGEENKKAAPSKQEAVFYVEIERVGPNPYQPRKEFDTDALKSLAESIRDHGILQPLVVNKVEKSGTRGTQVEYQLIAGERRLLASKMAGLSQVPVIVREPTDREKLELSIIENVQRMDLNPMEKANAYKRLQEDFGFKQTEIARLVGKSREAVANTIRLLDLPEEIKEGVKEEKISEGHARAILVVKGPEKRKSLFTRVVREGLSARETEDWAQKLNVWKPTERVALHVHEELRNFEKKFNEALGQKILLRMTAGKPKLTIFFASKKELEKLLERIK